MGTGDPNGDITLKSIDAVRAETLRRELLRRVPDGDAAVLDDGTAREVGELARFRIGWIRFAPISFWTPVLGAGAFGVVLQVANWFGAENVVLRWISDRFEDVPLLAEIGILAVVALLVGAVASLAVFTEAWWQYTLEREPDGSLRIRRGLLIRRSTTFEERRLRGLVLVRPLGLRIAGAARLDVLATGLQQQDDDSKASEPDTLMPAAPLAVTVGVAHAVLGDPVLDPDRPLIAHPCGRPPSPLGQGGCRGARRHRRIAAAGGSADRGTELVGPGSAAAVGGIRGVVGRRQLRRSGPPHH